MAGDFSKKTKSDNWHASAQTSARYTYVDGSVTTPIVISTNPVHLIKVVLSTNGATLNLKNGSRQIGTIASDAPEGPFPYGVYCENGLTYQASGAMDALIAWLP